MQLSMFDPEPTDLNAPFWEGVAQGKLHLPRCSRCGAFQWYPDSTGPDCAGAEYEWVTVAGTGTVHTMSRVHRPFLPGQGDGVPYLVGIVDLDEAPGVRLVAQLVDLDGMAIGERVRAAVNAVDGGQRLVFELAAADGEPHPDSGRS